MIHSKFLTRAGPTVAMLAIFSPVLCAQDASPELPPISLWEYIQMSGIIGWCICILSVVALALVLENLVTLRRDRLAPPELVAEVRSLFDEGQYQDAMELCENDRSFFARVCAAGIVRIGHPYERIEHALQEAGNEESIKLHQKVLWLNVIGVIAPMMGLFGTVYGMIIAFRVISTTSNPTPALLATGIYMKLLTTFEGLMVAIPVMVCFVWIRNRLVRSILEVGAIVEDLFEKFRQP
ncbi:MAG TPA: MotA/TolQ/ExbB proton channel family protein [Planctomycetota bacterium]|nr:MotA/TolQ/ExbB proton channel family protein [Planctomycetota bacterium]